MAQKMMRRLPPGLEDAMEKISATEELTMEHAELTRILLAMDNCMKAAGKSPKSSLRPVVQACDMINQLVVKHHMQIEEDYIYPKFEGTELADFAKVLKDQHGEARKLVAKMENLSKGGRPDMGELQTAFKDFKDMITAHAAYEETCLFPAMNGTWSDRDLADLREKQEEAEKKMLGEDAAQKVYSMLGDLESSCGVEGLRDFTRRTR